MGEKVMRLGLMDSMFFEYRIPPMPHPTTSHHSHMRGGGGEDGGVYEVQADELN